MKAASLVVRLVGGEIDGTSSDRVAPLIDIAKKVRDAGQFNGRPVAGGIVFTSFNPLPIMRFKCEQKIKEPEKKKK